MATLEPGISRGDHPLGTCSAVISPLPLWERKKNHWVSGAIATLNPVIFQVRGECHKYPSPAKSKHLASRGSAKCKILRPLPQGERKTGKEKGPENRFSGPFDSFASGGLTPRPACARRP